MGLNSILRTFELKFHVVLVSVNTYQVFYLQRTSLSLSSIIRTPCIVVHIKKNAQEKDTNNSKLNFISSLSSNSAREQKNHSQKSLTVYTDSNFFFEHWN